jgi:DNA-binding MarR family transcriptional regulator
VSLSEAGQRNGRSTSPKRRRSGLRFETFNAFVDEGMANLTRSEVNVWLVLYRDTKPEGTARTSLADIARRAGIDRQTASRAVTSLRQRKMLQIIRRGGLNRGPSTYRVYPFPMEP